MVEVAAIDRTADAARYRRVIKFCALQRGTAMNKRKLTEKILRSRRVMGVPSRWFLKQVIGYELLAPRLSV